MGSEHGDRADEGNAGTGPRRAVGTGAGFTLPLKKLVERIWANEYIDFSELAIWCQCLSLHVAALAPLQARLEDVMG